MRVTGKRCTYLFFGAQEVAGRDGEQEKPSLVHSLARRSSSAWAASQRANRELARWRAVLMRGRPRFRSALRRPGIGAIDALTVPGIVPHQSMPGLAQKVVQGGPARHRFGLRIAAGNALLDLLDGQFLGAKQRTDPNLTARAAAIPRG